MTASWGDIQLGKNGVGTEGIGLFGGETIAAVNGLEEWREVETLEDAHADVHGLVGKDDHGNVAQLLQGFLDTGIRARKIELVLLVIRKKKLQGALELLAIG